ncbi:glycoside hydrolase [Cellulomonas sp. Sa3CUA2]|uniref:beta-fructofuranosidase n=1 Tax=Cellulomonas avistercoris TaxID=2762242 RepID=A0ABR8QFF8_9CELL|nr:glycoside hydrolase [Cellulomonas avistercoris]MBD7919140.1 glycoside hydrolase [Cellulomonas avistercoris]
MKAFYKPRHGVVGDCIPHHADGRYHLYYLREYRDLDSFGWGSPWHHVSTTDGATFVDHGEAIAKGSETDQDPGVGTGSVFTDDDATHHIFYTGINPRFRDEERREQVILHATSTDLDHWTKDPGFALAADESRYERHDWRDPFVYRHPTTGEVRMLVAARTRHGEPSGRGCTVALRTADLRTWEVVDDYAPGRYHGHECPDLFQIGDWYYLVFSEYTTHTVTRYVMSRSPDGPWHAPVDDQFDNRAFYAAKSAAPAEGGPRLLFGWNPTKEGGRDDGEWQWGGNLTVHEVLQRPDGSLGVRPPRALLDGFAERTGDGATVELDGTHARSSAVAGPLPSTALVEARVTVGSPHGSAGVLLHTDANGHGGYFLRLHAGRQVMQLGKVGGYRSWFVDHFPELDRPLRIVPGRAVDLRIVLDGSAVVVYADDVALSGRLNERAGGWFGAFADGAGAAFQGLGARARTADRV